MDVLKIKLIDQEAEVPGYATDKSAGIDLRSREDTLIPANGMALIPLNVAIQYPEGYVALLFARSSTPKKYGFMAANSVGVIDRDYCGDNDEIKFLAFNPQNRDIVVLKGERIAQLVLVANSSPEIKIVKYLNNNDRGGFGSTG